MTHEKQHSGYHIQVQVETEFLAEQSDMDAGRWVYAYHVTIRNEGQFSAQLLTRHWIITDGEERIHEVHGEGVVGERPRIAPGESYEYSSGAILETSVGSMHGSYQMLGEDGTCFEATIQPFTLAPPHTLH